LKYISFNVTVTKADDIFVITGVLTLGMVHIKLL